MANSLTEQLESRILFSGVVSIVNAHGTVYITGDDNANSLSITGDKQLIQWSTSDNTKVIVSGDVTKVTSNLWRFNGGMDRGFNVHLGGGDDTFVLNNLVIAGEMEVHGEGGNDTITLDGVHVGHGLDVDGESGNDTIALNSVKTLESAYLWAGAGNDTTTVSNSLIENQFIMSDDSGAATIQLTNDNFKNNVGITTGNGRANVSVDLCRFAGASSITTANKIDNVNVRQSLFHSTSSIATLGGDDTINISGTTFEGLGTVNGGAGADTINRQVLKTWDFHDGTHGWTAGVSGVQASALAAADFSAGIQKTAKQTGFASKVYQLSAKNLSNAMLLYITTRLTAADGIRANENYQVRFDINYLSDQPTTASTKKAQYLKVGGTAHAIHTRVRGGKQTVNVGHGVSPSTDGVDASTVGILNNGNTDKTFEKTRVKPFYTGTLKADAHGNLSLFVGAETAVKGISTLRIASISVSLLPIN